MLGRAATRTSPAAEAATSAGDSDHCSGSDTDSNRARWCCGHCEEWASPWWFVKTATLIAVSLALVTLQFLESAAPIQVAASLSLVAVMLIIVHRICKVGRRWEARRSKTTGIAPRPVSQAIAGQANGGWILDRTVCDPSGTVYYDPPPSFTEATATYQPVPPNAAGVCDGAPSTACPATTLRRGGPSRCCSLRQAMSYLGVLLLIMVLAALMTIPFFVPAVPLSTGVSFTTVFILASVGSQILPKATRIWKAVGTQARHGRTGTRNHEPRTRVAERTGNEAQRTWNAPSAISRGQMNSGLVHDPPPPFTEALAVPAVTAGAGLPDYTPQGQLEQPASSYSTEPDPATSILARSATGGPVLPSYEEAIAQNTEEL